MKMLQNDYQKILELLKNAQNKYDIDLAIHQILEIIQRMGSQSFNMVPDEILQLFREKIFDFIFAKGDIADKSYLCLYVLFLNANKIDQFAKLESIAIESLFANGVSDNENVMLLELAFLAKILNGKAKEGLEFYLQNIVRIDIHCLEAQKNITLMLQFFETIKIPFEIFSQSLKKVLQENFFSFSYKEKRSVFNWQLHFFWNLKHFFNHRGWLEFYEIWKEIFYKELDFYDAKKIDFALYLQFFIYHMCGNNFSSQEDWKKFNQEISLYAAEKYQQFAKHFVLPECGYQESGVIGILRDRLVENSPYKVEYSFLKVLLDNEEFKKKYKVKLYLMSLLEKSDDDAGILKSYTDLGIEVVDILGEQNKAVYYNSHLEKALVLREKIIKDGVEILISPNNGYGISDFLLATRAAKKQIFWSHGNFVYDIPCIDKKITHICGNQEKIMHEGYEFIGIPVKMDDCFYNPYVPEEQIAHIRAQYPKDYVVLGNIGRLVKIDHQEFLQTIISIMQQNPKTIFLACGGGNKDEICQKIKAIDSTILSRFYFTGFVDSALYGHVIDIWLDSFPMAQGESRIEFSAKGKPSLILSTENKESRIERLEKFFDLHREVFAQKSSARKIDLEEMRMFVCQEESFVAFDREDYIKKANALILMPKEVLSHKMLLQILLKEVNDTLRENKGKKAFLDML